MKVLIIKYIPLVAAFLFGFVSVSFAVQCVDPGKLKKAAICVDNVDWDPYIDSFDENGHERKNIEGIYVYMANAALECAGYDPQLKLYPWKQCSSKAEDASIDAIYVASYKQERTAYFDYPKGAENTSISHPQSVGRISYALICHQGVKWTYDGNLKGRKIGGISDYSVNDVIREQGGIVEEVKDHNFNLRKILKIEPPIDCFVVIEPLANKFMSIEEYEGVLWKQKRLVTEKNYYLVFSKTSKTIPPEKRQMAWDFITLNKAVTDKMMTYFNTQKWSKK